MSQNVNMMVFGAMKYHLDSKGKGNILYFLPATSSCTSQWPSGVVLACCEWIQIHGTHHREYSLGTGGAASPTPHGLSPPCLSSMLLSFRFLRWFGQGCVPQSVLPLIVGKQWVVMHVLVYMGMLQ